MASIRTVEQHFEVRYQVCQRNLDLAINTPSEEVAGTTTKTYPVRFTDVERDRYLCRVKEGELSISTDPVVVSEANTSQVDEGGKIVGKIADIGDQARPAIRAIWFLYTERLTRMKDASEQSRIDTIIAEAVLATDARRVAAASPKNVFFMIVSFLVLVCSMQS